MPKKQQEKIQKLSKAASEKLQATDIEFVTEGNLLINVLNVVNLDNKSKDAVQ